MAGFNATEAVEKLEYNFGRYDDDQTHEIPEPSSDQVATFWSSFFGIVQRSREAVDKAAKAPEDETAEQRDERLKAQIVEGQHRTVENLAERRKLVAALCSNEPSIEKLEALPHRIFDAFESYMLAALNPEASGAATTS